MNLFHSTNVDFDVIDLSMSKPNKDFGRAFYVSEHPDEIAPVGKAKVLLKGGKFVMQKYVFDEHLLTDGSLNVLKFDCYCKEWANFIFANRNFRQAYTHSYDVVFGPIANDNVGEQIRKFRTLRMSLDQFLEELKYAKGLTFQYAFCTQKAVDCLKRVEYV